MATTRRLAKRRALVYRGSAAHSGCPEAVAKLFELSPLIETVEFVGPDEGTKLTPEALKAADIYAQPGGGGTQRDSKNAKTDSLTEHLADLSDAWPHMKGHKQLIQDFVRNGGIYLGFCLGAYLAAHDPGFDLLDMKDDTDSEVEQGGAQVTNPEEDTVIQVDWNFSSGSTEQGRWMYFQDGPAILLDQNSGVKVLGRYSKSGNPCATLSRFGEGLVGIVGPHPEADEDWCEYERGFQG